MKESSNEKRYTSDKYRKKKKKKHKKRRKSSTSSDCESSDGEVMWVEASASSQTKTEKKKKKHKRSRCSSSSSSDSKSSSHQIQQFESHCMSPTTDKREHWMNEETFVPTLSKEELIPISSSRQKRIDSIKEQREKEEKIQQDRELNPHWKHTGTGLPEKDANVESLSLPSTSVGDGGYSWLKKAYYRIQEQAQRDGRSMEEVAVERWGSLKKLVSMIEEAEARMKSHPDHKKKFYSLRDESECYLRHSNAKQFKIPHDNENESSHFDNSFKFQKPDNKKPDNKINQFKSSRKPYSYNYSQSEELQNTRREVSAQKVSAELQLGIKSSSSKKDGIPAWKKHKYTENQNKELPESISEAHLTSKTINTMKNNIDSNEIPVMYSEEDLNKLAACQMKAEILGNTSLASTLKQQLEDARNTIKVKGFAQHSDKSAEVIVLTKISSQGQVHPLQTTEKKISDYKHKKSNKGKYFNDDSKYSLKQMFEREKLTTADDQMEMFVEASFKCDDSTEIDFELGNVSKKLSQKLATGREEEKDIGKAIRQHQKLTAALEKCEYCLDQARMKKYLIVDIGEQVYLSLPKYQTITEGHCLIVPKTHISSFLSLDENEWREVNLFKNELRNMFRKQKRSVIFLETSINLRYHPHAILECIPIPEEEDSYAPMYFKKAIQESEAEWANNVKLVDLTKRGLRHSVPKNLPYFHVEFDPKVHAGFAHVIEEEQTFPHNFGKEVLGGMLDIDFNQLYKNKKEDPLKKSKEVVEFLKMWKKFKSEDS